MMLFITGKQPPYTIYCFLISRVCTIVAMTALNQQIKLVVRFTDDRAQLSILLLCHHVGWPRVSSYTHWKRIHEWRRYNKSITLKKKYIYFIRMSCVDAATEHLRRLATAYRFRRCSSTFSDGRRQRAACRLRQCVSAQWPATEEEGLFLKILALGVLTLIMIV